MDETFPFRLPMKTKDCQLKNSTCLPHQKGPFKPMPLSLSLKRTVSCKQIYNQEEAGQPLQAVSAPQEGVFFDESVSTELFPDAVVVPVVVPLDVEPDA